MDEMYKPEKRGECNVYITVNCDCKEKKGPPCDWDKECKECNVYITVNCGKEEKWPH